MTDPSQFGGRSYGKEEAAAEAMLAAILAGGRPIVVAANRTTAERLMARTHRRLLELPGNVGAEVVEDTPQGRSE
jgi:hypothetical protein